MQLKCNGHFQDDGNMVELEAALAKQVMCFTLMCCRVFSTLHLEIITQVHAT
jgi:hypothetical protein